MKQPCEICGRVHCSDWARAVDRFNRYGVSGYMALIPNPTFRETREEAIQDACDYLANTAQPEED